MPGFWNIPNTLSVIRIALVPVFVVMFFLYFPDLFYIPLTIFLIASLTDVADGIIARKSNQITPYGIVLDPLADKLLKIAVLLSFGIAGIIPIWISAGIVTLDISMIIMGIILYRKKITIPSNILGKAGTFITSCGIVLCFFAPVLNGWNRYILYAGLITVLSSFLVYFIVNIKKVWGKVFGSNR